MRYKVSNGYILISPEDKEFLDQHNWRIDCFGYVRTNQWNKEKKKLITTRLHQMLLPVKKGNLVDHINRNRSDNRRENLREVTYSQNYYNSIRADKLYKEGKIKNKALYLEMNS